MTFVYFQQIGIRVVVIVSVPDLLPEDDGPVPPDKRISARFQANPYRFRVHGHRVSGGCPHPSDFPAASAAFLQSVHRALPPSRHRYTHCASLAHFPQVSLSIRLVPNSHASRTNSGHSRISHVPGMICPFLQTFSGMRFAVQPRTGNNSRLHLHCDVVAFAQSKQSCLLPLKLCAFPLGNSISPSHAALRRIKFPGSPVEPCCRRRYVEPVLFHQPFLFLQVFLFSLLVCLAMVMAGRLPVFAVFTGAFRVYLILKRDFRVHCHA